MPTTPVEAVRAAIAALDAEDWIGAARLCDPASLALFHQGLVRQFAPAEPSPELSEDDFLRLMPHMPHMPREFATFVVSEHRRQADTPSALARELADVPSPEALRALAPEESFARWLAGHARRHQLELMVADGRLARDVAERQLAAAAASRGRDVLGAVHDGPVVAHVLFRRHPAMPSEWSDALDADVARRTPDEQAFVRDVRPLAHPSIATCRRQADGCWLVVADRHFLGHETVAYEVFGQLPPHFDAREPDA